MKSEAVDAPDLYERRAKVITLLTECRRVLEQGLTFIVLVKTYQRRPRSCDRVRVMPGVIGRIIGSQSRGQYIVSVKCVDLVAALERVMLATGGAS